MKKNKLVNVWSAAVMVCVLTASLYASNEATVYELDKAHSRIGFSVGHMGISTVSGQFKDYDGKIHYSPGPEGKLAAKAVIEVKSIDTGIKGRDDHLMEDDFFAAEEYPQITFDAGKSVKKDDSWVLKGSLTMRGTTREIELPMTVKGPIDDPWGNQRIGLQGETVINRHDYGVGSDKLSDKMVGKEVTLEIALEATAKKGD